MTSRVFAGLILCAALLGAAPAAAGDMMFAEDGPAVLKFHMPDDWTSTIDGDKNMLLSAPDHHAGITLSIITDPRPPEAIVAALMTGVHGDPPQKESATTISGHDGTVYAAAMVNDKGTHLKMKIVVVRVDATYVAVSTTIYPDGLSTDQLATLDAIVASFTLSPPA